MVSRRAKVEFARPPGWNACGDVIPALTRSGHVYRGMESAEFRATIGRGLPLRSTGRYSHPSEGTCFGVDADTAESYANFGSSDPRKTKKNTYLVEVRPEVPIVLSRDGYWKSREPVPLSQVTRVWAMVPVDDAIVLRPCKVTPRGVRCLMKRNRRLV